MNRPPLRFSIFLALLASGSAIGAQQAAYIGRQDVSIYYDDHSVPHIFGKTDEAAFYGLGYQQMIDLPIGTLNMLWRYSGRMAEVIGPSYLDEDRLIRLWEVPKVAARHRADLAKADLLRLIRAYVRGVEAGRAWWRNGNAEQSARIKALVGPFLRINVDPVPDFLNHTFSPFGDYDDPNVPVQIRRVVHRLFGANHPVTVDHVLRLGAAMNSWLLYRANPIPLNVLPLAEEPGIPNFPFPIVRLSSGTNRETQAVKLSNGWLLSRPTQLSGGFLTLCDNHSRLNKLHIRPYLVQVKGEDYSVSGLTMPGYPAVHEGFNRHVSWLFTAPVGDAPPVAQNEWSVKLEPSSNPQDLKFTFDLGPGNSDTVYLQKVQETLPYYDPLTDEDKVYADTRYYVPRHAAEDPTLRFSRYPVIPETADAPVPEDEIRFMQAAFTYEGSPWEFFLKMGFARNATTDLNDILSSGLFILGNGNNMLMADSQGHFRYLLLGRFPRQGAAVPPSMYDEAAELDGSKLSWRWEGFHTLAEVPGFGADVTGTNAAWICNNVTPDHVETNLFDEADLVNYPEYMVSNTSISNFRQLRAEALLRNLSTTSQTRSQTAGSDVRNQWLHMMWPFFESARVLGAGVNAEVDRFIIWMNEYRSHDESDAPNAAYDFEAHEFSQVMVYAVLLKSHYQDELAKLAAIPGLLTPEQASFGSDALHPLYSSPGDFDYLGYSHNIVAMNTALDTVTAIWKEGSGAFGLVNESYLASLSLPGNPWSDPRYQTDIEPHWAGEIAGTKMTRWGHVNMTPLTPHFLAPPKRKFFEALPDKYDFLRGYVYTAVDPPLLDTLPYDSLKVPFYNTQVPILKPTAGTDTTLFLTSHTPMFWDPSPLGYQESVYAWSDNDSFFWHPQTGGAQSLFSVYLRPNRREVAFFLQTIGGTEITRPDLLNDGSLAHQRRWATLDEFGDRQWLKLETNRALLGEPTFELVYGPPLVDYDGGKAVNAVGTVAPTSQ